MDAYFIYLSTWQKFENMGQAEMAVHMLNWVEENVKFLGVEFDQSEDEEVSVPDTTHLWAKDFDFRVECLCGGIGRTTTEVVQDSWSVVLECFDYRAEVVVT